MNQRGIQYLNADRNSVPTNESLRFDRETYTPASNHALGATFEADGDGWTDFIGGRYELSPILSMNQGDGSYVEVGAARGLSVAINAETFAAGDFNNDGDQDLVVTSGTDTALWNPFFYQDAL